MARPVFTTLNGISPNRGTGRPLAATIRGPCCGLPFAAVCGRGEFSSAIHHETMEFRERALLNSERELSNTVSLLTFTSTSSSRTPTRSLTT